MDIFHKKAHTPSMQIQSLWEASVAFHGMACTNLAIGVRVCDTALRRLGLSTVDRNRLVCVSETDNCCVDAIQSGLGCSIGKKHLLFFNTGRMIFSIYDLVTNVSLRICVRPEVAADCSSEKILAMDEDSLFYFEEARPMTPKVLKKVNRGCFHKEGEAPHVNGSVQDSLEPFWEFDESKF